MVVRELPKEKEDMATKPVNAVELTRVVVDAVRRHTGMDREQLRRALTRPPRFGDPTIMDNLFSAITNETGGEASFSVTADRKGILVAAREIRKELTEQLKKYGEISIATTVEGNSITITIEKAAPRETRIDFEG